MAVFRNLGALARRPAAQLRPPVPAQQRPLLTIPPSFQNGVLNPGGRLFQGGFVQNTFIPNGGFNQFGGLNQGGITQNFGNPALNNFYSFINRQPGFDTSTSYGGYPFIGRPGFNRPFFPQAGYNLNYLT